MLCILASEIVTAGRDSFEQLSDRFRLSCGKLLVTSTYQACTLASQFYASGLKLIHRGINFFSWQLLDWGREPAISVQSRT